MEMDKIEVNSVIILPQITPKAGTLIENRPNILNLLIKENGV